MAEITAALVGKLREMTSAGLMNCKKALTEAGGDLEKAVDILRKSGAATAAKRAARDANEGSIALAIKDGGKTAVLLEVNCETPLVPKNELFQQFCIQMAERYLENENPDVEADREAIIARIGENIKIGRVVRWTAAEGAIINGYVHHDTRKGVIVEVAAEKSETLANPEIAILAKELSIQCVAFPPVATRREEVPADIVEREKTIAREQMAGKPENVIEGIVKGKLNKFFEGVCLVDQLFYKDQNVSCQAYADSIGKELEDKLTIRRFARLAVGEN
ncbi:MAG: translation elongation factor Ts [Limisphaerales bacterium]|jgi:elongation factor Ts|nr:translation elongation factor Ts [Verrucomicrobiota bacterium]